MPVFQRITPIFVNVCTCVYWSVSPVLGTRVCKAFVSTCLLKKLHMGYRCHSVPAAVSRRSSLGVSKAEPSGSIQAALSTSRGKATAAEKKASLSFSLSLSLSLPHTLTQITFLCHFMFYSLPLSSKKFSYFSIVFKDWIIFTQKVAVIISNIIWGLGWTEELLLDVILKKKKR